ncbi:MAG TPA: hypothetical protein VFT66_09140 [Roseiflexaceae bacterium]|jgi:hypothetical protein|nr:hypothetical protein [Roseiflexaceae bacterium]
MPGRKRARTDSEVENAQHGEHHESEQGRHEDIEDTNADEMGVAQRSVRSVEEGGDNKELGEPQPGYGTVQPGIQGGGKR